MFSFKMIFFLEYPSFTDFIQIYIDLIQSCITFLILFPKFTPRNISIVPQQTSLNCKTMIFFKKKIPLKVEN